MRPAFSSTEKAAAFVLLLLLLLLAPWLAGKRFLPPREQAYASAGWGWGPYPWIQKQIFDETNDIDIAFMGSSRIDWAIDTPYVQEKLDERLGRKTVVRSICWAGNGFDALAITARDLLEHRHVKTLVFCDESGMVNPGTGAVNWCRWGDDAGMLSGLPIRYKAYYYFAATVEMPRNLLELLTPNLPEETNDAIPNYYEANWHAPNPEKTLGAVIAQVGYRDYDKVEAFAPYLPQTGVTAADVFIYTPATATNFAFSERPLPVWQVHFLEQLESEAKSHDCKLVVLHVPVMEEKGSRQVSESAYWPGVMGTDVAMMGVPTGRLFAGMTDGEIKRLFSNSDHMNENGVKYFTPLIVPALIQLYESKSPH
jgi:hypothetical protein